MLDPFLYLYSYRRLAPKPHLQRVDNHTRNYLSLRMTRDSPWLVQLLKILFFFLRQLLASRL